LCGNAILPANMRRFRTVKALSKANRAAALLITDRILSESEQTILPQHTVTYRPKSLVVGIGCNRGTAAGVIEEALTAILSTHGLSMESIGQLATIDTKKNEPGLLEFSRKKSLRIDFFESACLAKTAFPSPVSHAALKYVGAPSVCESAAVLSSANGRIIVPKTSYKKAVTVAVARINYGRQPDRAKGKVYIIGIGPGDISQMTLSAREAIDYSDVILGYKAYIKLIEPLLSQEKEVIGSGMGAEVERARQAIDLAKNGRIVSVVSSGDAGIYGMAGLIAEIIAEYPDGPVDMEVIPGVPAFVAASALLGAPLMNDFVSISLSDHLIPWKEIRDRLKLAAQGDFIILLYNPKSKQRPLQLTRARNIILKCRPLSTPVGVVTNAYRPGQHVIISDLERMLDCEIGMNTIVIIGSSQTFASGGRLITRRGYQNKYFLGGNS